MAGHTASVRPEIDEMREYLLGNGDRTTSRRCSSRSPDRGRAARRPRRVPRDGVAAVTLVNRNAEPEAAFNDAVNATLTQNHLRSRPLTTDLLGR
jgi:hypothetical protein